VRVFAISDIHVDYEVNADWVGALSTADFKDDVLILAGDVSDSTARLATCLQRFAARFRHVLFVPGNHELWVIRERDGTDSWTKFARVTQLAADCGVSTTVLATPTLAIVPMLSWYDYSFGRPTETLLQSWADFGACRWEAHEGPEQVTRKFLALNKHYTRTAAQTLISFSHFLPRIDLMPTFVPPHAQALYPVLGTMYLDEQVRRLGSDIHVYGHSHLNRDVTLGHTRYVNNAFGYPSEERISRKQLACIWSN
jgi:predicted phosphodiesterase